MKYFPYTAAFGNFNCYSTANAKDFASSLQVFALTPDILVVRAKGNRNKDLTTMNIQMGKIFITNRLFLKIASRCFLFMNFTITLLLESLLYLEAGKRWHPSMSFGSISTSESWQMPITTFSRLSSGISFGIPDNSILLRRLYRSDLA